MSAAQTSNPPHSPLVRGDDASSSVLSHAIKDAETPPLIRGGREGLVFLPYDKNLTALARKNRQHPSAAEQKIWLEVLSRRQFSAYKFLRQKPIAKFIVDFYCAKLAWVIEIDGDSHVLQSEYDADWTRILQGYGLTVIRYNNRDVMNNITGVYDDLLGRLK